MRFSPKMTKWLKVAHLFCVCCWVGGALSLVLLHITRLIGLGQGSELHGIDRAAHWIDMGIVVALGAIGCAVTGLLYSLFTKWGFFKHRWIMVKWLITIGCILFGTFALGPWEVSMMDISAQLAEAAHADGSYNLARWSNFFFGFMQSCVLVYMLWISIIKPWKAVPSGDVDSSV